MMKLATQYGSFLLGATRWDVLKMVVSHGLRMTLVGVTVGFAASLALTRLASSLLYQVKPTDPKILAAVSLALAAVAALARYLPARRATRADPMVALRYE